MPDISVIGAFFGGLLSFLSPCVLPIVPFYLSYLAGQGVHQVTDGDVLPPGVRRRAVFGAVLFALGVITVFVALGASSTMIGQALRDYFDILRWIAAAMIIAMGLHFLGLVRIPILYRQFRAEAGTVDGSILGAYVIGLAFAFGWTPCVGPILAAILFTAAGQETARQGALLLSVYGVGMTLPFVLAAAFIGPFLRWMRGARAYLGWVEKITGAMLVVFGLLIATDQVSVIAQWMLENVSWFSVVG